VRFSGSVELPHAAVLGIRNSQTARVQHQRAVGNLRYRAKIRVEHQRRTRSGNILVYIAGANALIRISKFRALSLRCGYRQVVITGTEAERDQRV
jgi:hypothetical protein